MKRRADVQALANALGGVALWGCLPGSPADVAGLRYGDVILSVDGEEVKSIGDFLKTLRHSSLPYQVVAQREADVLTFEVTPDPSWVMSIESMVTSVVESGLLGPVDLEDIESYD